METAELAHQKYMVYDEPSQVNQEQIDLFRKSLEPLVKMINAGKSP